MSVFSVVLIYLELINLAAFAVYGIDKRRARLGRWRVPEAVLLLLAAVGGSVGALFGMRLFHHKTKKPRFSVGVPVILAMQIGLMLLIIWAVGRPTGL